MKLNSHSISALLALSLLLSIGNPAVAANEPVWSGQWIGPAVAGSNCWLCFRRTFQLDRVLNSVPARLAVDSKYWLWVNGNLVVFEGGLKRGPTPLGTYYDEVELGPTLKKGDNTIAVLVWYWGKHGFSHNSSGKAGLVFEADVPGQKWLSGSSWKILQHPAFGPTETPFPNFRLAEFNIAFDARKDIAGWNLPQFDDGAWPSAAAFGMPPVAPWNHLEKRPILPWKNSGLLAYASIQKTNDPKGGQRLVAKLPYNAQVTPYLKVKAPAGESIDIRTDDYLGGGSPSVRSVYVTRDGVQEFESLGWMNGHEVHYQASAKVKFLALKYRETGYNADFEGQFQCSDPALNTLWEKARRTLYITMRDNYMDCPDRERAQWWGDMVNELGEAFYVFDAQKGPLLTRKGIYELARWQRPDRTLYSPVPAGKPHRESPADHRDGTWNVELPPQMLASVGKYGFWTYYWHTGDRQTIADVYPSVRDYLQVWQFDSDGLVIHRPGDWDWEDWGKNIDAPVMDSAWYYLALEGAINMASLCGWQADVPEWRARQMAIRRGFNAKFWTGKEYRSRSYQDDTDDRANALAVVAGLADEGKYPALKEVFARHFNASPYMEKYVLEALYLMQAPGQAMARMKKRWSKQIDSWTTTLWEGWGLGAEGYGGGTYNHAWSGGALTVLSQYAAGVAPDAPAFDAYHVLPSLGPLASLRATVPTPKGLIHLRIEQKSKSVRLELESPAHTTALVGLPVPAGKSFSQIRANGAVIWKNNAALPNVMGPVFELADTRFIRFRVPPGKWRWVGEVN